MQEDDPRRDLLATVITQWRQHLTAGQEYTVQQLINHAINVNDFHVALLGCASMRSNSTASARSPKGRSRGSSGAATGVPARQTGTEYFDQRERRSGGLGRAGTALVWMRGVRP